MNFKNFENDPPPNGRPSDIFSLARQSSVYSLTFDEFQNTMGGIGKDFGSMNMDELLKNIWSAEETQTMGTTTGVVPVGQEGNNLQRQGSLTLPRTISQKTVDEVWKDMSKEYGSGASKLPPRQPTLGEVTLEEFLFRAGVVREDAKLPEKNNNDFDLLGDLTRPVGNQALGFGYQQMGQNNCIMGNRVLESNIQTTPMNNRAQPNNLPLQVNEARSTPQQHPQIFPKQPTLAYANPIPITTSAQMGGNGIRNDMFGITDPMMNGKVGLGMMNVGTNGVTVATGSPSVSSDGMGKNNGDTSSVSPVPYVFTGGLRGRRSNHAVEKVIERRQRRMIKNRESAARSRARKQAYTMELEAEVAKLKEENDELRKKQAEIVEMQKNKALEMINKQQGGKRCRLKRTHTGPW